MIEELTPALKYQIQQFVAEQTFSKTQVEDIKEMLQQSVEKAVADVLAHTDKKDAEILVRVTKLETTIKIFCTGIPVLCTSIMWVLDKIT